MSAPMRILRAGICRGEPNVIRRATFPAKSAWVGAGRSASGGHAESLARCADEYGELLFEAYGREQLARDPELLR
jgi:hypothetical protein